MRIRRNTLLRAAIVSILLLTIIMLTAQFADAGKAGGDIVIDTTSQCTDAAEFVTQSPYPTVSPGQTFQIFFEMRNTGTCTWRQSDDYYLGNINGAPLGANPRQELGGDVPTNATKRWTIDMVAPTTPGTYRTQWMVKHGDNTFGPDMFIGVTVSQPLRVIAPLTLTPANPISGQTVTAQLTVKNVGEQAIGLRYLAVSARGPDSPACTDWDCPWADFPPIENLTLQPNQEYTYYSQRSFDEVGDYFAQANYQGLHDPEDAWYPFGNQVEFTVSPGLTVVEPLTLTPANPIAGQTVTAQFAVKNGGEQPITLPILTVPARGPIGPACTDWDCPWADFQAVEDVTLQPDEEYAYSAQRSFDEVGDYFAQPDYRDAGGYWHPFGDRVAFSVSPGVQVVEDLSLSPADPVVGQTITARFKIKNASEQTITLRRLVVGAKGPNCTDWECPNWGDFPAYEHLTLQPAEEFIYERQRLYTQAGDGYFAQIVYMYGENDWHHTGTKIDFAVSPGLQIVEDLTLSPASPLANQPVTARYKVKNVSGQTITLHRLGVVARGPDCTDWGCANGGDFPWVENVTLQPDEEYEYSAQRSFTEEGSGYFAEPAFADPNDWWYPVPGGSQVEFSVSPDLILRDPLTISPSNPVVGQPVTFQFTVANVSAQTITLHYLTVRIHRADCTDGDCPIVELPGVENLTLQPNMEYTYRDQWTFTETGCYFAVAVYQDAAGGWHLSIPGGNRVEFCVSQGLTIVAPLTLTPANPIVGGPVTAEFAVQNKSSSQPITLLTLRAGGKGPDCSDWNCDNWADFPPDENITLQPGQEYTYSQARTFTEVGCDYFAEPVYQDTAGVWHLSIPDGNRVEFCVGHGLRVIQPLTLSPTNPIVGQPVTAQFMVKNESSSQPITLLTLRAGGKGPDCTDWNCDNWADFPPVENITLQPNQEYTYSQARTFTEVRCGYFAEPVYQDANGAWHLSIPDGNRVEFCVSPTDSGPVLSGRVALERRGDPGDDRWITQLIIKVGGHTFYTTTDAYGHFSVELTGTEPGTYNISVKSASTLSNKRLNISLPSDTEIDFGTLRVGDSNGDDRVNGADVSYMVPSFLFCSGDGDFRPHADANKDGCINGADVSALVPNFLESGDDVSAVAALSQAVQFATDAALPSMTIRITR